MDVFDLRNDIIGDYGAYVRSFLTIKDERIRRLVQEEMDGGFLWPDPLIQLNPSFEVGETLQGLIDNGELHSECINIFRDKPEDGTVGAPFRLHRHQIDGIRAARAGDSYVLTTGTGSGKSLSYIVPIVDHVLRRGSGKGIQAIIVYPMNALANSQVRELEKFLCRGYPAGSQPVTFRRYTGQESDEERREIIASPPDILLTNYVMLELVLPDRGTPSSSLQRRGCAFWSWMSCTPTAVVRALTLPCWCAASERPATPRTSSTSARQPRSQGLARGPTSKARSRQSPHGCSASRSRPSE